MTRPLVKPIRPEFSSGPCAKRPEWSLEVLKNSSIGRSHRHIDCKSKLNDIFQLPTEKDKRSILEYIKKNRIEKIIEQYKTSDIIHYFPILKVDAVIKGSRNTIMNHI